LGWETTIETKLLALVDCERSAFVPAGIIEDNFASKGDTKGASVTGGHDGRNLKDYDCVTPP
jgi:hypothetical protein